MKKMILIAFLFSIYVYSFAQMPMNMPMPKEKPKKEKVGSPVKKKNVQQKPVAKNLKDTVSHQHNMEEMSMPDMNADNKNDTMTTGEITDKVNLLPGKTVRCDLYVKDTIVNFTGKSKHAYAING